MTASLARVPCTIVTGFLGAGKTTLIRHVLANAQGRRLAVIVNEFGDVGIDGEILKGCGDAACPEENIVELANGCLCCTVADEFVPALDTILSRAAGRRAHRDRDLRPRAAEAAGAGLPLARDQEPGHRRRRRGGGRRRGASPTGRVAADLEALARQRAADPSLDHDDPVEEVFEDQIACADLVVLNKRDLLDAAGVDKAHGDSRGRAAARGQDRAGRRRQGRSGRAARPGCRHRGRHREPPHPARCGGGARPRRFRQLRRAAARDRRSRRARRARRRRCRCARACSGSRVLRRSRASRCACWCRRSARG